ncbi:MAG: alkaline phosphatase D family protein [Bryobacteraceae bacterium]
MSPRLVVLLASPLVAQNLLVTHGPLLGHVTSTQISIWGRTSRPGAFRVRYGTDPANLTRVSEPAATTLDRDNTGWARLTALAPNTRYYYELFAADTPRDPARAGSFRTLPDAAAFRDPQTNPRGLFNFRFEFGSCNNQKPGQGMGSSLPAFQTMLDKLRDKIHFTILNGDWLYEDKRDFTAEQWARQVGIGPDQHPMIVRLAPSITGVWENYKFFLERGAPLAAFHREFPTYFTPDDHEILNDVYGAGSPGVTNRRAVFRDIGMQGWYDYVAGSNPVASAQSIHFGQAQLTEGSDVLVDPNSDFTRIDLEQAGGLHVHWGGQNAGLDVNRPELVGSGDPNAGVYEIVARLDSHRLRIRPVARHTTKPAYSIGRQSYSRFQAGNVDFYLLDTRSHRELHDVKDPAKPGTSMIGRKQREWLIRSMKQSDADFFFIASSVNLMIPHVGSPNSTGPIADKDDAWTAFVDEREQLIRFWDSLGKPVIVMTGDLHNSFAVKVTDRVWEFGSGPHNSANHPARSEGGRLANGPFDSRGRKVEIRWSSHVRDDVPTPLRPWPYYAVAQVNNVYASPVRRDRTRWAAFPKPHLLIQYYDGITGDLLYAEPIHAQ